MSISRHLWRGPFLYFCSRYCSPAPHALLPFFESKVARLQYAGDERFNLAYFRHTGMLPKNASPKLKSAASLPLKHLSQLP